MPPEEQLNTTRFAVGTPQDIQSWIRRMWVHRDEVYIGARDALTVFKVSLHNSGIWRIAFVADLEREEADSDRVIVKWNKPDEFVTGWTPSVGILVSSIRPQRPFRPTAVDDSRVRWFAPPRDGQKLLFKVLFSKPDYSEEHLHRIKLEQDRVVARMVKSNREVVWLVMREEGLSPVEVGKLQDVMTKTKIHLKPGSSEDSVSSSRALLVISEDFPTISTQPTILDVPLGRENLETA
jgi:hypothetical protein